MTEIVKDSTATDAQEFYVVEERLFVDEDGHIVPETSTEAAFLYATPGSRVSLGEAIEKGIAKKGTKPAPKDPTPEPEGDDPGADLEGLKRPELEKLAKGLGIDLDALEGTGKDGNVVNNDVKDAIVKARAKQAESAENKQRKTAKNKGV